MITKMKIAPCKLDDKGNITKVDLKKAFAVQINPSDFARNFDITYSQKQAMGSTAMQPKYSHSSEKKIDFEIIMDGTGVVSKDDVEAQMKKLRTVVFTLVGKEHQPNVVMIVWGGFKYCGRLTSMAVKNTLFRPSGKPLRAKVKLDFIQYVSPKEAARIANMSSPDLTHSVEVMAGDTLPLLCYRIYKDCSYYMEIARVNGLSNFRELQPGTRLLFPPLR